MSIIKSKKWATALLITALSLPLLGFGSLFAYNYLTYNVHTVLPGEIYRSAEMPAGDLAALIHRYHLKAVINLRGYQPGTPWYQSESALCNRLHVKYISFTFDAHQLVSREKLRQLTKLLQQVPHPVLIHCRHGADRSGLAAATALVLNGDQSVDDFQDQMAIWYSVLSPSTVGYQVTRNYFTWLRKHQLAHSRKNFLAWVNSNAPLKHYFGWYLT